MTEPIDTSGKLRESLLDLKIEGQILGHKATITHEMDEQSSVLRFTGIGPGHPVRVSIFDQIEEDGGYTFRVQYTEVVLPDSSIGYGTQRFTGLTYPSTETEGVTVVSFATREILQKGPQAAGGSARMIKPTDLAPIAVYHQRTIQNAQGGAGLSEPIIVAQTYSDFTNKETQDKVKPAVAVAQKVLATLNTGVEELTSQRQQKAPPMIGEVTLSPSSIVNWSRTSLTKVWGEVEQQQEPQTQVYSGNTRQ